MNTCIMNTYEVSLEQLAMLLGVDDYDAENAPVEVIRPASYPDTPFVSWVHDNVEQVVAFANADDAKTCFQALRNNGIAAGFSIPVGYKEIPFKRYAGDGLLSNDEMDVIKARLDKMTLVH